MNTKRLRIGIVGLQPGHSWAAVAHVPGIRSLSDKFQIAGIANRSHESSVRAAKSCGIARAFNSVDELVGSDDIDIVTVTVRVPHHRDVVTKAINAGKAIYCEWPLAKNLAEAQELAALARAKGVRTFIGTQAIVSPQVRYLKHILADGCIGEVLSHSITGYGRVWGPEITDESSELYLLNNENGATMLTIPVAHMLAALQTVFGKIGEVNSILATRRSKVFSQQRKEYVDMTAPDQVAVQGVMEDGSVLSLHYRGGTAPDGNGFLWEVNGTEGVLRVTALTGSIQIEALKIEICRSDDTVFREVSVPRDMLALCPDAFIPGNVARMYEMMWYDLATDSKKAPDFADALDLHRLVDKIEKAALKKNVR